MRVIRYDWPRIVSPRKPAIIYDFSDTHFGNPNLDKQLLTKHIKACKREKAAWLHLGDWCEFITPKDRRFDINDPPPTTTEQIGMAVRAFRPIKDQCIAVLSGNHEYEISKTYGCVMGEETGIATSLGVEYLGYSGFIKFDLSYDKIGITNKSYKIFVHHGHGMGRLLGAKTINLQRMSHKFAADIYLIGHIHTYLNHSDRLIGIKGDKRPHFHNYYRVFASAPCYFDSYQESDKPNYVERKALYPQRLGCLRMEIGFHHRRNTVGGREREWYVKIEPLLKGD